MNKRFSMMMMMNVFIFSLCKNVRVLTFAMIDLRAKVVGGNGYEKFVFKIFKIC